MTEFVIWFRDGDKRGVAYEWAATWWVAVQAVQDRHPTAVVTSAREAPPPV